MRLTGTHKWLAVAVALPLLLTSCIIEINTNNFSSLNKEQHTHFRPFSMADADKPVSYDDRCVLQRINHHDLELLSKTHPLIWVEGFAPWCGGVTCQNIGRFATMANACNGKVKLVLVSQSYDLKDLQQRLSHSGINRMVYVLDTGYSKHYNHALKQLFTAVRKGASYYDYGYNEFLLRNDSVVYVRDGRQTDAEFTTVLKSIADGNPAPLQPQFYPKKKHTN